ncbi:sugar kinase [Micromonospora sagamiensis]|uniref:2-dehydro-3-deoxygluconokinase n=1 Tax=Micromonospora sagamiensis TaxID=47875 RepID=A0A562WFG4_9ACTN|nr:sugar kinase [Micromonospora sagamiensis]TWJ28928.1 2-dehydro-3-deoxygluconokinase [Micromonospora sagamiensis]BCL18046.1 carbohydrate kinase [Micromonospora sagamiensis]
MTGGPPGPEAVTVGETMVVFSPDGSVPLDRAERMTVHVGGAESNVAMYLAALGHRAAWASRVGNDPFGRMVLRHVADAGVDVTGVTVDPDAPTGVYVKDPAPDGTRVHYYRAGSAASRLDPASLAGAAGARLLHLSGITPVLSGSCRALVEAALVARPLAGVTVSFDVNYRPRLWPVERAAPVLRHLADHADVVFVGLDEAWSLWRTPDPAAVRRLLPGPSVVVVKDGAVGATALAREGRVSFVPALRVPVVEPVGAGDAFAAGYLSALLRDLGPVAALRWGHLVAAHALRVPGDHAPLSPRADLDDLAGVPADRWPTVRLPDPRPEGT